MKRPIGFILLLYVIGLLTGQFLSFTLSTVLVSIGAIILSLIVYKIYKDKYAILGIGFFILGFLVITLDISNTSPKYNGEEAVVRGVVKNITYTSDNTQKLYMNIDSINNIKAKLSIIAMPNKDYNIKIGDELVVLGNMYSYNEKSNQGGFNDEFYMKRIGVDYRIYSKKLSLISHKSLPISEAIYNLRLKVSNITDKIYGEKYGAIVKAIVSGDKTDISEDTRNLYTDGGAIHILCISGLHISVIISVLVYLFKNLLKLRDKLILIFVSVILLAYSAFIGFTPSVMRASIMGIILLSANALGYDSEGYNSVFSAGIIILLISPYSLFDAGFLLSFSSVLGVIMSTEAINNPKSHPILSLVSASIFAVVMSIPIMSVFFYNISFGGIISNLFILPLTPIVVIFSLLSTAFGLIYLPLGVFLGGTSFIILRLYEVVLTLVLKLPFLKVNIGIMGGFTSIFYYTALLIIVFNSRLKGVIKHSWIVFTLLAGLSITANRLLFKENKIAFLDVDQGDSSVITTYDGKCFVIDTGGSFNNAKADTGNRVIIPYLESLGENKIDILFLSHPDMDHALGSLSLMDNIEIERIVVSDYAFKENNLYDDIIKKAYELKIPIDYIKMGDIIDYGNISFKCLYPIDGVYRGEDNSNSGSMVLMVNTYNTNLLYTGDIDKTDEGLIIDNGLDLNCDVLKVSHHGSRYSTSNKFVYNSSPDVAIISVGRNNIYGHPSIEAMDNLSNSKIYETDNYGAITIITNKDGYTIETMKR